MRLCRLLFVLVLVGLVGCGTAEVTPTARPRAAQIATATQVALDTAATQVVRGATQTAQAIPTATATATTPPTPTVTRTPTFAPTATIRKTATPRPAPTQATKTAVPAAQGEELITDTDLTQPIHAWRAP